MYRIFIIIIIKITFGPKKSRILLDCLCLHKSRLKYKRLTTP